MKPYLLLILFASIGLLTSCNQVSEPTNNGQMTLLAKEMQVIHYPEAPDTWIPYAPAISVTGGTTVYLAGVTAAPTYHQHPHVAEEFDIIPTDMEGQARLAMENVKRGLDAAGASFSDVVFSTRYLTDTTEQEDFFRVWQEYFGEHTPATTTVQVVRLATDPRLLLEINVIAVKD
ncbi:MAG: RidA family protein [Arenicellaceae bacterium]|nr:RidA family protein [Arenicellaceae bacterium]